MRYKSVLHETFSSIERVGLKRTTFLAASRFYDAWFDYYYKIDTKNRIELCDLEIDSGTEDQGQMYQPTGILAFKQIMQEVQFPKPSVFVDYGSGKGRTLLLAACESFDRVIGIEFSKELCEIAEKNIALFEKKRRLSTPLEIVHKDAALYDYAGTENVFYFFYPFDAELMTKVLKGIEASLQEQKREAVLVYYYPIHQEVLDGSALFKLEKSLELYGYQCLVYRYDGC